MTLPTAALAARIDAVGGPAVNLYPAPQEHVIAPAIVIRPDEPWITRGATFGMDTEHYVAVAVVTASSPGEGLAALHDLVHRVMAAEGDGWAFVSVGRAIVDEATGVPYLATPVRLTYSDCGGNGP